MCPAIAPVVAELAHTSRPAVQTDDPHVLAPPAGPSPNDGFSATNRHGTVTTGPPGARIFK